MLVLISNSKICAFKLHKTVLLCVSANPVLPYDLNKGTNKCEQESRNEAVNIIQLNMSPFMFAMVSMNSHIHFIIIFQYVPPQIVPNVILFVYYIINNSVYISWCMDPSSSTIPMVEISPQVLIETIGKFQNSDQNGGPKWLYTAPCIDTPPPTSLVTSP